MGKSRVLIHVVCYHAERFIVSVLNRIPSELWENDAYEIEVLVVDDKSGDRTFETASKYARESGRANITILTNPKNLGYGGNQKVGYSYAIGKGFDCVVLLHGDGQYAPELLGQMIAPIVSGEADVVLGSRMIHKRKALKGGMPLYKWVGNQVLTRVQNWILGTCLSEFHTGYRAFSVAALTSVPFMRNSDYFDFDSEILIQMLDTAMRFKEIESPTYYGEEISRVNGLRYAFLILGATISSRLMKRGILYDARFDYKSGAAAQAPGVPASPLV